MIKNMDSRIIPPNSPSNITSENHFPVFLVSGSSGVVSLILLVGLWMLDLVSLSQLGYLAIVFLLITLLNLVIFYKNFYQGFSQLNYQANNINQSKAINIKSYFH